MTSFYESLAFLLERNLRNPFLARALCDFLITHRLLPHFDF
jgi:hypothetical protein